MKYPILPLYLCLILMSAFKYATAFPNSNSNVSGNSRAMYVDGFASILGDATSENTLLEFAQAHDIQTLLLYELHLVHAANDLSNPNTNEMLANFITKAKVDYQIQSIGATAENDVFFTQVIDPYNNSRPLASEKFDIYNLEFEFWNNGPTSPGGYYCNTYLIPNGYACTNDGAFQYFVSILQSMQSLASANAHPITTEAYVGWPTESQAAIIGDNLDKLRLHAYVTNPNIAFSYTENRLIDFAAGAPGLNISIIYSSETSFMQSWLVNNSISSAESEFLDDWNASSDMLNESITLDGFTYFTYSEMLNIPDEICPSINKLKDITINSDTSIYAKCIIELNNVIINPGYELTLMAPDLCINGDSEVIQGAKLTFEEGGCPEN